MSGEAPSTIEISGDSLCERLQEAVGQLKAEAKSRVVLSRALAPLAKSTVVLSPKKLAAALEKLSKKVSPEQLSAHGLAGLVQDLYDYRRSGPERRRRELGLSLKRACEERGLDLRVISREDPVELRIPPLALKLDFAKSKAEWLFARDPVATCALELEQIIKTYDKALKSMDRGFEPKTFFQACRNAYCRILRVDGLAEGARVELSRFVPELAFLMQPPRFQSNPTQKNYRSYSRAQLAYNVFRLRRASGLSQAGYRINFGVATGNTARQKKRVIYMEDEHGRGQYCLNVFFSRVVSQELP